MTYLYCEECEEIFPEDHAKVLMSERGNMILACPECRNTWLQTAWKCGICGEPMPPGKEYCDECKRKAYKIWEDAVCKLMDIAKDDMDYCDCEHAFVEYLENEGII